MRKTLKLGIKINELGYSDLTNNEFQLAIKKV